MLVDIIMVYGAAVTEVSSPLSGFIIIIIMIQVSGFDCSPLCMAARARAVIRDVSMLDLLIKSRPSAAEPSGTEPGRCDGRTQQLLRHRQPPSEGDEGRTAAVMRPDIERLC